MKNNIVVILFVAFLLRFLLLIINNYFFVLPQAGADAIRFERIAFQDAQIGLPPIEQVISSGANFYVWLGSILYSLLGRVPMIWGVIMVLLGTGTVYNVYKGVLLITENIKLAKRSAWIAALFPNLVVLSAILLREAPIHFFISLSIVSFIKYIKYKSIKHLFLFLVFGTIGAVFHSGMFSIFIGFILYSTVLDRKNRLVSKIAVLLVAIILLYGINYTGVGLSKFGGTFEGALAGLETGGEILAHGRTNYPSWLLISGTAKDFLIIPVRVIAFLFAPFLPLFLKTIPDLLGGLDGFLYFLVVWRIVQSRKILLKNRMSKGVMIVAITVIVAFSFGSSNFGTNIRHRTKVLPLLLMVPLLNRKERNFTAKFRLKTF